MQFSVVVALLSATAGLAMPSPSGEPKPGHVARQWGGQMPAPGNACNGLGSCCYQIKEFSGDADCGECNKGQTCCHTENGGEVGPEGIDRKCSSYNY